MITLSVDCMGGDHGLSVTLPACRHFLEQHPDAQLICVVLKDSVIDFSHPRLQITESPEMVEMDDSIEVALRRKKKSSMRICIEQVRDSHAQVAVSAGNTGALMAIARYVLKTLDGIERPAIAGQMPNAKGGGTTMLDLGANVDCTAEHLLQFAVMGSALVSVLQGIEEPTVGLLNIGEEAIKGGEMIKRTGELMRSAAISGDLNFYGNVEGNDIYKGTVDVVVCDGFVGNVALKASEGVASLMVAIITQEFKRNWLTMLMGMLVLPVIRAFRRRMDPRSYNGASFLGLKGIVVKSHGSADSFAFGVAIDQAIEEAANGVLQRITAQLLLDAHPQTNEAGTV